MKDSRGDQEEVREREGGRLLTRRDLLRLGSVAAGSLALGGLLGGCSQPSAPAPPAGGTVPSGGTAPSGGAAPTSAPVSQPKPSSGQVIKIGAPYPLTGPWAESGNNCVHGIKLAVEHINAKGGIERLGGAKLSVVSADAGSDPALAASVTRRLIENDKVTALVGAYVSSLTLPASTEAEKSSIPMLTQSYADQLTQRGYKYMFQLPPRASVIGASSVSYFKAMIEEAGIKLSKAVVVASNDASNKAGAEAVAEEIKKVGFEFGFLELFATGLSDASAIAAKIRDSKAEMAYLGAASTPDAILITRTMRAIGLKIPIIGIGGGGWLLRGFGEALKADADGVFGTGAWNWDHPYTGVKEFNADFAKRFNEPFVPQEAGESYIATWNVKDALEQAGSADPTKLRDALASMNFDKGPASWMPGGKVKFGDDGLNQHSFPVMIEWKDGLPRGVWPKAVQVMKPVINK